MQKFLQPQPVLVAREHMAGQRGPIDLVPGVHRVRKTSGDLRDHRGVRQQFLAHDAVGIDQAKALGLEKTSRRGFPRSHAAGKSQYHLGFGKN